MLQRPPDALRQPDALFMGSTVVSGQAQALVCAIGDYTVLVQVAQDLVREPEPTAFDRGTRQFGAMLMRWGAPDRAAFGWACINSRFASGVRSPLDEAILVQATDASVGWRRMDELAFDFVRRRVSVAVERDGNRMLVVKGVP